DHLDYFQGFDHVKVYYDNGQAIVKKALDESVSFALSKQAIEKRRTTMTEYRLAQVADYLCTIELAAVKYAAREAGGTYDKFFGGIGSFKKNWLKQARRKRLD
ncbi:MAG: ABC transporter, partial [Atopobiaceae bacterium]|nr:ABC transporter [Atopobiaceae bacterium]